MIRALALDIDGTITYPNRQLDVSAVGAIRKAEKSGIPVCLATGNILCFARTTSILLGTSGPLISEDGGVIYEQSSGNLSVLASVEEVDRGMELLEEECEEIHRTSSSDMRIASRALERTIDVSEIERIFRKRGLDITAVDSGFSISVKSSDVNKGKAIQKIAEVLGIPVTDMAAIGDAPNDVEMLETVGLSFAPKNANSRAKEASSYVLSNPYGSGVREAIDRILKSED